MNRNSANRVILVGYLGGEAEIRYVNTDVMTSNFRLATNTSWKTGNGEYSERTDWHRITAWRNLAEYSKTLAKGQMIYLEGHLQNREWVDKDDKKHSITEVVAETITTLGGKKKTEAVKLEEENPD